MKNILIFGASSAIAEACAKKWAIEPCTFFLVARNSAKLAELAGDLIARGSKVSTHAADLGDMNTHEDLLNVCFTVLPKIDIALVAYGTLPNQDKCAENSEMAVQEFTVNGLSVIALLNSLAIRMAPAQKGCIAVISSVAGDRGRPSNYLYGSAKSAVSAFCSGLRGHLIKSGVHVLTIKPGFVDTPMTQGLNLPKALLVGPEKVAGDIVKAIDKRKDSLYTPWFWRYIMLIIIHIPSAIFKRLSI
jgi:decaprenylphospho-beta-D-erythro-pentofuranosid-2-ulose 2-reductase